MILKNIFAALLIMAAEISASAHSVENVTIDGSKGKLAARVELPQLGNDKKCNIVILCHGFSGNMNGPLHDAIANNLLEKGIGVVRFDFNGHGASEGAFKEMTVPNEIEDLKKVIEWTLDQTFTRDLSLVGHSQGGVVAAMTAGQIGYPQIKALALMAPAAALRDDALRGSTMGAVYDPLNVPAEGIKLPWGGQILGRDYITTALSLPIYETAALYTGPTFIIHGTADRVVPYTYGERFNQVIKGSEINLVDKDDHVFSHTNDETASKVADFFSHSLSKK